MKYPKILLIIMFLLISLSACCFAADDIDESDQKSKKLFLLPIISSSPETGFALGGMCFYYPNIEVSDMGQNPDLLTAMLFGTEKGQYVGNIGVSKYFFEGKQWLLIQTAAVNYPGYVYGIGSDTTSNQKEKYTLVESMLNASYLWDLKDHLYFGPSVLYANASIAEKTKGGLLDSGDITGQDGINATGVGVNFTWDKTKDFARQGFKISLETNDFSKNWGNEEEFTRTNLDYRKYIPISDERLFAIQGVLTSTSGSVPFQFMPTIGNVIRGIEMGRFTDKNLLAFQAEYRFPIRGIFSMTVFGGFGEVAPSLSEFNSDDLKTAGGIGFRFAFDKEHNVNLRLDISGTIDEPMVYLNFGEAF